MKTAEARVKITKALMQGRRSTQDRIYGILRLVAREEGYQKAQDLVDGFDVTHLLGTHPRKGGEKRCC